MNSKAQNKFSLQNTRRQPKSCFFFAGLAMLENFYERS